MQQLAAQLLGLSLARLSLAEVADEGDETNMSVGQHVADVELGRKVAAVPALGHEFARRRMARLARLELRHEDLERLDRLAGEQRGDPSPAGLFCMQLKHLFGGRTEGFYRPRLIEGDHGVRNRGEDGLQVRLVSPKLDQRSFTLQQISTQCGAQYGKQG